MIKNKPGKLKEDMLPKGKGEGYSLMRNKADNNLYGGKQAGYSRPASKEDQKYVPLTKEYYDERVKKMRRAKAVSKTI